MHRQWYLIDDDGVHPLSPGAEPVDFWARFERDGEEAPWPAFTQLILRAGTAQVAKALARTGPRLGVGLTDVLEAPEEWVEAMIVAADGEVCVIGEPGVDLDEKVMAAEWAEALVEELGCDGAYFGHDPAASTLHLTRYESGAVSFEWCDSVLPGPSYAMVFDEEGACRSEDPRKFALRAMDLPETSPLLDRHRFVMMHLTEVGLQRVSPDLSELPVQAAFLVHLLPAEGIGGDRH